MRSKSFACNPAPPACVSETHFSRVKFAVRPASLHLSKICLRVTAIENHAVAGMPPTSYHAGISTSRRKFWLTKLATFLIVSTLIGSFYGWSFSRAFPKNTTYGFGYGMLHGALMPLALPSLLLGHDVEIFAPDNSGRPYKIGYICGINLCGMVFFGPLFWRPRKLTSASSDKSR
jgi:hypothetical protein